MEIRISVKNLVEFVLRGGSIDNRFGGTDRALLGSKIHRKLQKAGGKSYLSEVYLTLSIPFSEYSFVIEGRADGVIQNDGKVIIDEIKTTAAPLHLITEDYNRLHWAQAMCYGYMLCVRDSLKKIIIQLTYYQIETDGIKRFQREYSISELEAFYFSLLHKYEQWAKWQTEWQTIRNTSIRSLIFPFASYRTGQRELAVAVYKTIEKGMRLYLEAPTGIGKSISTLFPSIKAQGEGKVQKIFYLTAKTITKKAAQDALFIMQSKGLRLKSVTLTAKDKICFLEERNCNPDACEYANGHYDRVNDAIYELLQNCDTISRDEILECAKRYHVCPFELSLDLTLWCDLIICDYNYLFDPTVYLKRFFTFKGDYVFLVDEAHNLIERSREMYSARLLKSQFMELKKKLGKRHTALLKAFNKINAQFLGLRREYGENCYVILKEPLQEFNRQLIQFCARLDDWQKDNRASELMPQILEVYFSVLNYLKIAEFFDERYVLIIESSKKEVSIKQFCIDPSYLISEALNRGLAAVLFSATLSPLDYFSSVLGADETSIKYHLLSPFKKENLGLFIARYIDTRYQSRERSKYNLAKMIAILAKGKIGNYLVYFPSYSYMRDVYEEFARQSPDINVSIQSKNMDEALREQFLETFNEDAKEIHIGFCVLGGIFSEGIDLPGNRLIGTVIVGVGLPQINPESDLLKEYYGEICDMGFEYAYMYPGMNKVLQAAGRVIRTQSDRGIVILADDRFCEKRYQRLFPAHWSHYKVLEKEEDVIRQVDEFWSK